MPKINHYLSLAEKRKRRVRAKLHGTSVRPRLTVSRSNKFVYIQVINDEVGATLVAASDIKLRKNQKKAAAETKTATAIKATQELVAKMKKAKITAVVFDRGQYKYHGRVKAIADTLRDNGVKV